MTSTQSSSISLHSLKSNTSNAGQFFTSAWTPSNENLREQKCNSWLAIITWVKTYITSRKRNFLQLLKLKCIYQSEVGDFVQSIASQHLKSFQVPEWMVASSIFGRHASESVICKLLTRTLSSFRRGFPLNSNLFTLQQLSTFRNLKSLMCLNIICNELSVTARETPPKSKTLRFS